MLYNPEHKPRAAWMPAVSFAMDAQATVWDFKQEAILSTHQDPKARGKAPEGIAMLSVWGQSTHWW